MEMPTLSKGDFCMLDVKTIRTVKATASLLKDHIEEIGSTFYQKLFTRVPDLYNMFNQTNQKRGLQQEALAYGVYLAGANIDNLKAIESTVERVAEKHRALDVKPEQYPIVGDTLLEAIKEVLGTAATKEVMDAWEKAYQYIADAFINIEDKKYKEMAQKTGGWTGNRTFYVDQKIKESDVITSFYLKPEDQGPIASYLPGQYLTIQANIDGEKYAHKRHYSLSDAPDKDYYRISVKREDAPDANTPAGVVSNYLHQNISEGDTVQIAAPAGNFVIETNDKPIVLLSGGVGITPMMGMLNTLVEAQPEREVTFIHAALNGNVHAMKDHVLNMTYKHDNLTSYFCYEKPTEPDKAEKVYAKEGFIDLPWLKNILSDNQKDFYFCGPMPFLKAINGALKEWGVPVENRHYELFTPMSTVEESFNEKEKQPVS